MAKPGTSKDYTLDDLKQKAQKALEYPRLVEIVKNAPLNKDGKVNLSLAYKEAENYVHGETKDLQKTKELAVAARWLTMIRRDYSEEFERFIGSIAWRSPMNAWYGMTEQETKTGQQKRDFSDIEFALPYYTELLTTQRLYNNGHQFDVRIRFPCVGSGKDIKAGCKEFCMEILNALIETADSPEDDVLRPLEYDLIRILEEKFGLKVKVCGTCKHFTQFTNRYRTGIPMGGDGDCPHVPEGSRLKVRNYTSGERFEVYWNGEFPCWTPKAV